MNSAIAINFIILAIGAITFYYLKIRFNTQEEKRWKKIPNLRQYLKDNPKCIGAQIKCNNDICREPSGLNNVGWSNKDDSKRTIICNSCGKILYREES